MGCNQSTAAMSSTTAVLSVLSPEATAGMTREAGAAPTLLRPAVRQESSKPKTANTRFAESQDGIRIQVSQMGGKVTLLETNLSATVSDVKAVIHKQLGYAPERQALVLGEIILADGNALLKDIGVKDASMITLLVNREPLGQSMLVNPHGKKAEILPARRDRLPDGTSIKSLLSQFEFQSWQAACKGDREHNSTWNTDEDEEDTVHFDEWPNFGQWGADFYWTTGSDGCRYEYWSSAPGDNEYGILVRIDADSMTAIGSGSDDGLELFEECVDQFQDNEAIKALAFTETLVFDRESDE